MAATAIAPYGRLLRNRDYRLWFTSSLASATGDWVGIFALQILVVSMAEQGSRLALFGLGGIMTARLLPSVLFGPVAGIVADRYDRKRSMVLSDVLRGALFVWIAFSRNLVALLALTFVVEIFSLLYMSSKDASLPVIVARDELAHANQLNLMITYGPLPFGALAGTAMVGVASLLENIGLQDVSPITLALLFNAATFLVGGGIIGRVHLPGHARGADDDADGDGGGIVAELAETVRYIRDLTLIRSLIIGVVAVFFGAGVVVTVGPEFVRTSLDRSGTDWFTLMVVFGTGLAAGLLTAPFARQSIRNELLLPSALVAAALVATVIAVVPRFDVALALAAALGVASGLSFVSGYTLLHENTRHEIRARTFAAFYTSTRVAMFSALALAPFVAGAIGEGRLTIGQVELGISGIRVTIFVGGIVALAGATATARGVVRHLRDQGDGGG